MAQCHKNGSIAVWAIRESSSVSKYAERIDLSQHHLSLWNALPLFYSPGLKFYFTPNHYFPFQTRYLRPATTSSIMTIKLHQRTLHPLETSLDADSLRLKSMFQEHRVPRNVPFFADPQFPRLSFPFFSSLSPPPHYRHSWPRYTTVVKWTPLVARGGLTFRACRTVFRAFVSSISRFVRDRLRTSNPSPSAHLFLANSRLVSPLLEFFFFFFYQFLTPVSTNLTRKVDWSDSFSSFDRRVFWHFISEEDGSLYSRIWFFLIGSFHEVWGLRRTIGMEHLEF